jgi:hypothetical protein
VACSIFTQSRSSFGITGKTSTQFLRVGFPQVDILLGTHQASKLSTDFFLSFHLDHDRQTEISDQLSEIDGDKHGTWEN